MKQQGRGTQSVIEKILADFKSRVDPEDFVPYLTRLEEEDEVSIIRIILDFIPWLILYI